MEPYYPSDLSDGQWERVEPLLPKHDPKKGGRPRIWGLREILSAIFYIEKRGCQWHMLPKDFPPGRRSGSSFGGGATRMA